MEKITYIQSYFLGCLSLALKNLIVKLMKRPRSIFHRIPQHQLAKIIVMRFQAVIPHDFVGMRNVDEEAIFESREMNTVAQHLQINRLGSSSSCFH